MTERESQQILKKIINMKQIQVYLTVLLFQLLPIPIISGFLFYTICFAWLSFLVKYSTPCNLIIPAFRQLYTLPPTKLTNFLHARRFSARCRGIRQTKLQALSFSSLLAQNALYQPFKLIQGTLFFHLIIKFPLSHPKLLSLRSYGQAQPPDRVLCTYVT